MHTFVVRVFVASDLDGFVGVVEEPLTGLRRPFDGPDDLVACLVLAARRPGGARRATARAEATPLTKASISREAAMHQVLRTVAGSAVLALVVAAPVAAGKPDLRLDSRPSSTTTRSSVPAIR